MFGNWFGPKQENPAKKVTEPEAPFAVDEITELIEGKVDFQVQKIVESKYQGPWEASGKAIMHLPAGSTRIQIVHVADKYGTIKNYVISYATGGKIHLFDLGRRWTNTDGDTGKVNCEFTIDEVEV